jgi:hypothetical protein
MSNIYINIEYSHIKNIGEIIPLTDCYKKKTNNDALFPR